jgi:hypothetical protein
VGAVVEDRSGTLWFGTSNGASAHEPDHVAPQTVVWPKPPSLTSSTIQTIAFTAAYGEYGGIRFSHSFDGSAWSEWLLMSAWTGSDLPDGDHVFEVTARDEVGNVDSTPAVFTFEVDATPPGAIIASPAFGEAVRDSIVVFGTAADPRFLEYTIEVRAVGSEAWDALAVSSSPVAEGSLGEWDTRLVSDGDHELRLSVRDTLGLTGIGLVRVEVDNEAPWAWETTPVLVREASGGDIYTTNREVHLYFPPRALAQDALVTAARATESSVPDSLPGGVHLVFAGYEIGWEGVAVRKPATLEMMIGDGEREVSRGEMLALYVLVEGEDWRRLGGTLEGDSASLAAPITEEGTYAIFSDSGGPGPGGGLSVLSFTPRVFSPSGSFANTEVAVSFTLGQPGPVTVRIYNRAGRLVDEVATDLRMNAGANVVRWDGRDRDGSEVPDGLYIVTVEALGEEQVRALAVVR